MDRRKLLGLAPLLLMGGCRKAAEALTAPVRMRTFADLVRQPDAPLSNRALVAVALPPRKQDGPATVFAVRCAACGSDHFDVRERRSLRNDGSTKPRGINLVCHSCQLRTVLFDAVRDGHDGRLGYRAASDDTRPVEKPLKDREGHPLTNREVRYACRYNASPEELFVAAEHQGVSPVELFDLFQLEVSQGDGWRQVWDYQCV